MAETAETPVLDLLMRMNVDSIETSMLDPKTLIFVRLAALAAIDAPPFSYYMHLEAAKDLDLEVEDFQHVLTAIAPIVGTPKVAAATGNIVRALGISLEVADLEEAKTL
jgi:alkylhydroperoxidase/carboxymuconolactone decarboxylase family protein YurZ